jgi:hypothetical protein
MRSVLLRREEGRLRLLFYEDVGRRNLLLSTLCDVCAKREKCKSVEFTLGFGWVGAGRMVVSRES